MDAHLAIANDFKNYPADITKLTAAQAEHVHGWPAKHLERIEPSFKGLTKWLRKLKVSLWSDCAGGDMPYYTFEALQVNTTLVVASDIAAGPQKLIMRNKPPKAFHVDILKRNNANIKECAGDSNVEQKYHSYSVCKNPLAWVQRHHIQVA